MRWLLKYCRSFSFTWISARTSFCAVEYLVPKSDKVLLVKKIGFCIPTSSFRSAALTEIWDTTRYKKSSSLSFGAESIGGWTRSLFNCSRASDYSFPHTPFFSAFIILKKLSHLFEIWEMNLFNTAILSVST